MLNRLNRLTKLIRFIKVVRDDANIDFYISGKASSIAPNIPILICKLYKVLPPKFSTIK